MNSPALQMAIRFLEEEPEAASLQLELEDPDKVAALFSRVSTRTVTRVIHKMLPVYGANVIERLRIDYVGELFSQMTNTDIAAVLRHLDNQNRTRLLGTLPARRQTACNLLISFPEYTVGAWIETDVLILDEQMEVYEALTRLRKRAYSETPDIMVLNRKRQVLGHVSVYELIRTPPSALVKSIMHGEQTTIHGLTRLEVAIALPVWEKQDAVPVVNRKREFVGILHHYTIRGALTHSSQPTAVHKGAANELINAFGASLHGLVDALYNGTAQPSDPG